MSDEIDTSGPGGDNVLAAEYALGLLPEVEREATAARLSRDPELRAELRFWLRRFSSLDSGFAETAPPPSAWSAIERRLFASSGQRDGWWNSVGFWRSFSGVAVAVAMIAVAINVLEPARDPNAFAAELVAALSAQGSNVQVVALYNSESGEVRLTTLAGNKVPDKDYQLWAIQGSAPPKSLGIIQIDTRNDVKLPADVLAQFGPGTTLAISLEPLGGSPKTVPTGPVVAVGTATQI